MFRRALVCLGLVASVAVSAPSIANAEPGGGAIGTSVESSMAKIASGELHTCKIVYGGMVACWGDNSHGQLGSGDLDKRTIGHLVPGISTAVAVAAGVGYGDMIQKYSHTCVLLADTSVKCWGGNEWGQLGNGADGAGISSTSPQSVCDIGSCASTLTGVSSITAGLGFTCALLASTPGRAQGSVACWGRNDAFQLGVSKPPLVSNTPSMIPSVSDAVAVSAGRKSACAVLSGGSMKCWGENGYGQLGDGTTSTQGPVLVTASGASSGITAVAMSSETTCIINTSANVKCFGGNANATMGFESASDNPTESSLYDFNAHHTPYTIKLGGSPISATAITGGSFGFCAVTTSANVVCWGILVYSAGTAGTNLGSPNTIAQVAGVTGVTDVAMSSAAVCATASGSLKCWGYGAYGALANFGTNDSKTAVVNGKIEIRQTVTFQPISDRTTSSAPFIPVATVDSAGGSVNFTSNTPSVCTVNASSEVSMVAPGTCTISAQAEAYQSMSGDFYVSSDAVTRSFAVTGVAPAVSGLTSTSVTPSGATLQATVNGTWVSYTTAFTYGTSASLSGATTVASISVSNAVDFGANKTATATLTGLSPATTYYFRFSATNTVGTNSTSIGSFTTGGSAPTATTGSPTSVSAVRATLNGVVNPGDLSTTVWFVIGQKSDLSDGTKIDYRAVTGTTATDVSVTATGLTESVRYYYRLEASNAVGAAKGDIKSFTSARPVGVSVNDAAEFTNSRKVTVYATGPSGSTQVIISNDGGFGSSQTFDLTDGSAEIPWTLIASRDERLPKTVYARFVQRFGTQSSSYTDDIILDTTAPVMNGATAAASAPSGDSVSVAAFRAAAKGGARITVKAKDANSGIGKVQVKSSASGSITDVTTTSPKATSRVIKVKTTKKKLWVRVVDRAGNVSKWVTVTVK